MSGAAAPAGGAGSAVAAAAPTPSAADAASERGKAFVTVLSCVLSRLVAANDGIAASSSAVTKFHALRPPAISIHDYCRCEAW